IDLLVSVPCAREAVRLVSELDGVIVTKLVRRSYVDHLFLAGVEWGADRTSIQVDLISELTFKGVSYLNVDRVLAQARPLRPSHPWLSRPIPIHEAIASLFGGYLVGGVIKNRYLPFVVTVARQGPSELARELAL